MLSRRSTLAAVLAPALIAQPPAPRTLWKRPLGEGHSGIAIAGTHLYTMHRRGDSEVLVALNATSGRTLWEQSWTAPFRPDNPEARHGPHCTPVLVGDLVIAAGVTGILSVHHRQTGHLQWRKDLRREFGGTQMGYGYSSNPLPYAGSLLVIAGGPTGILRLQLSSGDVMWKQHQFKNSNASPVLIDLDGQKQTVVYAAQRLFAVSPDTGELLWSQQNPVQYGLPVVAPLWCEHNLLFVSSVYEGCRVLELHTAQGRAGYRQLWGHERARNYFQTVIYSKGVAWFTSGSGSGAALTALELRSGRILKQSRDLKRAQLVQAGANTIALEETGRLCVGKLDEEGYHIQRQTQLLKSPARTVPSCDATRIYVRDHVDIAALEL